MQSKQYIFLKAFIYYFFFINLFIYLFLAALGLGCCMRAFSSCGEQGLLFIVVHRLLIAVASLVSNIFIIVYMYYCINTLHI